MASKQKSNGAEPAANQLVDELPDDDELAPPIPPDGGWGWLVVAASFLTNLIVDGVCYTFGVIMPDLLVYFESSKGKTALVGSMVPGVYLIVGEFRNLFRVFVAYIYVSLQPCELFLDRRKVCSRLVVK